jgi:hypothetical protein
VEYSIDVVKGAVVVVGGGGGGVDVGIVVDYRWTSFHNLSTDY